MTRSLRYALAAGLGGLLTLGSAHAAAVGDHYGKWLGKVTIPKGPTLAVGFELFERADGSPGGRLVSPEQGVFNLPIDIGSSADGSFDVTAPAVGIHFHLHPNGDRLEGEAHQGPLAMPLVLTRVEGFGEPSRPQTPKAPFPYRAEALAVTGRNGVVLSGTLTRPNGYRPVTAIVLLHGSGPADRDESVFGHQPFAVLADYLTRHGVAVYRYDKRGVMRSTGDYQSATEADFAEDGEAAVKALKARKDIGRVGVLGHSEGGLLAAMIAADRPRAVDFVVSLAGPGLKGEDMILLQDRVGYEKLGLPRAQVQMLMTYGKGFYDTVVANEDVAARMNALTALQSSLSEPDRALVQQYASHGTLSMQPAATPALRVLLMSDAPALWRRVQCPVLALDGGLDVQVPPRENLDAIRQALAAGRNERAEIVLMPGLNHMFQTAKTGLADEYPKIDETMSPSVLRRIMTFLKRQS